MELYPYVRSLVRRQIGDIPQYEDVVQEVFVSCLSTLERVGFNNRSSLKTWIYRITMRRVCDELRRHYKVIPDTILEDYATKGHLSSPEKDFQEKEMRERIESGFFVLTRRERQVFTFFLNGWENWEVAQALKVSRGRVGDARESGLRKLRKLYGVTNGRNKRSADLRRGYKRGGGF